MPPLGVDTVRINFRQGPPTVSSSPRIVAMVRDKGASITETLEELIAKQRDKLRRDRDAAPELVAHAAALRASTSSLTRRFEIRRRNDVLRQAEALEAEAASRLSGARESDFERVAREYLRAYHEPITVRNNLRDSSRTITAPGSRHETAQCFRTTVGMRETHRASVIQEFKGDVQGQAPRLRVTREDHCPTCNIELVIHTAKAVLLCHRCGFTTQHLDSTAQNMSYTDDYDFSTFSYKRQSHFEDILKLVQGKESAAVPDSTMHRIMKELQSQRVEASDITSGLLRTVLKKMRLRQAYDHVPQIWMRLTGKPCPRISCHDEDECRKLFLKMQPAFERHCPKYRKNFLSYNYVVFRCFHILGLEHMLPGLSLLKGSDKLRLQDEIFKRIAEDCGWPFEPIETICARLRE